MPYPYKKQYIRKTSMVKPQLTIRPSTTYNNRLKGPEWKTIDKVTSIDLSTTGEVKFVSATTMGPDFNQRLGRQITLKSIQINGTVAVVPATGTDQVVRVLYVYDKNPNAIALSVLDVLDLVTVSSMRNLNNRDRFHILYDMKFCLNSSGEPGSQAQFTHYRKLNKPVVFNASNAGTIADVNTGSVYAIGIGSNVLGVTSGTGSLTSRIRFTDN